MLKKHKVVMLPTNEKAKQGQIVKFKSDVRNLVPNRPESLSIYGAPFTSDGYWEPQHLYILSDEEIKEGDYVAVNQIVGQASIVLSNYKDKILIDGSHYSTDCCKKIISTTDSSLTIEGMSPDGITIAWRHPYPQPTPAFIAKFVEKYNKGEVIENVMVEYEDYYETWGLPNKPYQQFIEERLKVNPKDNTITIKAIKDSWSRGEVEQLLSDYRLFLPTNSSPLAHNKWIEENL